MEQKYEAKMEQMRTEFQEKLSASKRAHEQEIKALRKTMLDEEGGGGTVLYHLNVIYLRICVSLAEFEHE